MKRIWVPLWLIWKIWHLQCAASSIYHATQDFITCNLNQISKLRWFLSVIIVTVEHGCWQTWLLRCICIYKVSKFESFFPQSVTTRWCSLQRRHVTIVASQLITGKLIGQQLVQANNNNEDTNASHSWPFWEDSMVTSQQGSNYALRESILRPSFIFNDYRHISWSHAIEIAAWSSNTKQLTYYRTYKLMSHWLVSNVTNNYLFRKI